MSVSVSLAYLDYLGRHGQAHAGLVAGPDECVSRALSAENEIAESKDPSVPAYVLREPDIHLLSERR